MPLEWKECFDPLPTAMSYEEIICDRVGYRDTRRIHSLLQDHKFVLYVLVVTGMRTSVPENCEPLFQIQTLRGEIVMSNVRPLNVYDTLMHIINKRYISTPGEVEPPNRKRSRETRFSGL